MQIDKLSIVMYSRNIWEAFDLGCRMAVIYASRFMVLCFSAHCRCLFFIVCLVLTMVFIYYGCSNLGLREVCYTYTVAKFLDRKYLFNKH